MEATVNGEGSGFSKVLQGNADAMKKIDEFKNKAISAVPRNVIFACICLGSFVLFMLFASQILSGIVAMVAVVVTGVGGFFGLRALKMADPLIKQKMKNKVLDEMIKEARRNATRQLDNQVIENARRLARAESARDKMGALVMSLKAKINPKNEGKPIYQRKMKMLKTVEAAYEQVKTMLERGRKANREFEQKVLEYKDMESFTDDVQVAMSLFQETGGSKLDDMLSLEAFTHIEREFNEALVSIENQTADMAIESE